ncbi:unnamed protein product, partial [Tetraodon nigroviridis]
GANRQVQTVRQVMVDILQNHTKLDWPDRCPRLEPYSSEDLLPRLGQRSEDYTAIVVEEPDSYVGREVILDLLMFSGVQVKRALSSERPLVEALGVTSFPSLYLLHPNSTHTEPRVEKKQRFFFSSFLKTLPGVQRKAGGRSSAAGLQEAAPGRGASESWRRFDSAKVYTADLESGLHYLLRVELASHDYLEGEELSIFKDFVTLVAKLYPGGGSVVRLMEALSDWLLSLQGRRLVYQNVLDLVDNKMRVCSWGRSALGWLPGQQGGASWLPVLALDALSHLDRPTRCKAHGAGKHRWEQEAAPVLQVMRRYIRTFFGCQECGRHFEQAAAAGLDQVQNPDQQILWLWEQHNRVNSRLSGTLSDDPLFPKAPWPGPALCATCHEEKNGVHAGTGTTCWCSCDGTTEPPTCPTDTPSVLLVRPSFGQRGRSRTRSSSQILDLDPRAGSRKPQVQEEACGSWVWASAPRT